MTRSLFDDARSLVQTNFAQYLFAAAVCALFLSGCAADVEGSNSSSIQYDSARYGQPPQDETPDEESPASEPVPASDEPAREQLAVDTPHLSAGFLYHERGLVNPFCHAVLIAPDVIVTAASCARDSYWELSYGTGDVDSDTIPVVDAYFHPEVEDLRHALVALVLERPVADVEPATPFAMSEAPCNVELVSYRIGEEDGAVDVDRTVWTACAVDSDVAAERNSLIAMEGYPNCHGDSGAGAFKSSDGEWVLGWVTSAGYDGPTNSEHESCVTSVGIASAADNMDFLGDAMAMAAPAEDLL